MSELTCRYSIACAIEDTCMWRCPTCGVINSAHFCAYCNQLATNKSSSDACATIPEENQAGDLRVPPRRCAKCGSVMVCNRIESCYVNGVIPWGKAIHFRCCNCEHEIDLQSVLSNLISFFTCFVTLPLAVGTFLHRELGWQVALPFLAFFLLAAFLLVRDNLARMKHPRLTRPR